MHKALILSTEDEFMNSKPGDRYQGGDSRVVLDVIDENGKVRVNVNGGSVSYNCILRDQDNNKRDRGNNKSMSLNSAWAAYHPLYTIERNVAEVT